MDEVKSTPAPTALNRDRLTGIIWSATRAQALPLIIGMVLCALMALPLVHSVVRGEVGVGEISFFALFLALAFLVLSAFTVVLPAFLEWSGFGRWARRRGAEQHKKRFAALGDAHRAPFQLEQRSKLSATEEVWVRDARTPQSNKVLLEVQLPDVGSTTTAPEPAGMVQMHRVSRRMAGHPQDPPPFVRQGLHIV